MRADYERAGLAQSEVEHLSDLVAAVESADPTFRYVAVDRSDVMAVVEALDRAVSRLALPVAAFPGNAEWLQAVGMRVRLARVTRGESQAKLSDRCGVSRVTLGRIERGDHQASRTTYAKVAVALGVPLPELLGGPS